MKYYVGGKGGKNNSQNRGWGNLSVPNWPIKLEEGCENVYGLVNSKHQFYQYCSKGQGQMINYT